MCPHWKQTFSASVHASVSPKLRQKKNEYIKSDKLWKTSCHIIKTSVKIVCCLDLALYIVRLKNHPTISLKTTLNQYKVISMWLKNDGKNLLFTYVRVRILFFYLKYDQSKMTIEACIDLKQVLVKFDLFEKRCIVCKLFKYIYISKFNT